MARLPGAPGSPGNSPDNGHELLLRSLSSADGGAGRPPPQLEPVAAPSSLAVQAAPPDDAAPSVPSPSSLPAPATVPFTAAFAGYPASRSALFSEATSRQRSASPYAFALSSARHAGIRVHSLPGSGAATPTSHGGLGPRSPGPASLSSRMGRGAADSALLLAVRKQLDAFEGKLNTQVAKRQEQQDRLIDAKLLRLEEKIHATEAGAPKLDRRLAELAGQTRANTDELQQQSRRVDQLDARLWEWRHTAEEEGKAKHGEVERVLHQLHSAHGATRAMVEDTQRQQHNERVTNLEAAMGDFHAFHANLTAGIEDLHARCDQVDDVHGRHAEEIHGIKADRDANPPDLAGQSYLFEQRLNDLNTKVEQALKDSRDNFMRLETWAEKLNTVRNRVDEKDRLHREEMQKLNTARDAKMEQLKGVIDNVFAGAQSDAKLEHVHGAEGRLERLEKLLDEHGEAQQHLHSVVAGRQNTLMGDGDLDAMMQDSCQRLEDSETRLQLLEEWQKDRGNGLANNEAGRLTAVEGSLDAMVPKVDRLDREFQALKGRHDDHQEEQVRAAERIGQLHSELSMLPAKMVSSAAPLTMTPRSVASSAPRRSDASPPVARSDASPPVATLLAEAAAVGMEPCAFPEEPPRC